MSARELPEAPAIGVGSVHPLGATVDAEGVNFALRAPAARGAVLRLYRDPLAARPWCEIALDAHQHFDVGIWHVHVRGIGGGTAYTWCLSGPDDTAVTGHRFDPRHELLDPCARLVETGLWQRTEHAGDAAPPAHRSMRAVVLDPAREPALDDAPLHIPLHDAVIYELHVGGFTRHPNAAVRHPGTFLGLIEKIPYLQRLGITHVELMPVFAFDEQEVPAGTRALGLGNYWGYSTHSFFAPHPGYATQPRHAVREFRRMVKALHDAGLGVILDVVLNHTAEGGAEGAVINFKGIGNEFFYHLDPRDRRVYRDYTGCGNTVNANHPWVTRLLLDCLRYWVEEMHVDGFRFDIASALTRDQTGEPRADAPMVWAAELEPVLAQTHLIAEAWDAAGLYQVGGFPGLRWAEWNGRYRDCVRRFVHGVPGCHAELAARIAGSADLYQADGRRPGNSINFVTCHDGFTLADLVSYSRKHNEANGEDNRDGNDHNLSRNHGVEGPTDDPDIAALRARQVRNHLCLLLLSQGVPMLNAGDEVLRTQRGNNNAWCQDNEVSWFDWSLLEHNADMLRFVRALIALRARHPGLRRRRFLTGRVASGARLPDVQWHGRRLHQPAWSDEGARELAFTLAGEGGAADLHVICNMATQRQCFVLPRYPAHDWYVVVDTSATPPHDVAAGAERRRVGNAHRWQMPAHSILVLEGERRGGPEPRGDRPDRARNR